MTGKQRTKISLHKLASLEFDLTEVGDTCQWWGTEWEDDPDSKSGKRLKRCGEPTVGKGLFCSPNHALCYTCDVCERHSYKSEKYEV